jgi:hypothetical protein
MCEAGFGGRVQEKLLKVSSWAGHLGERKRWAVEAWIKCREGAHVTISPWARVGAQLLGKASIAPPC